MLLSELVSYAASKYQIHEDYKWPDFPGISVLTNPKTGKYVAVLMRQWDTDSGTEIQRCDIKCGKYNLYKYRLPYLSAPFRMNGQHWLGVIFDNHTNPQIVYQLFDQAVRSDEKRNKPYQITLEGTQLFASSAYKDTKIPSRTVRPVQATDITDNSSKFPPIPQKIREMQKLYIPIDHNTSTKDNNFYTQGMFMKDYEDDMPFHGDFKLYFPTYHDLSIEQLRGFFTWRTCVRKGEYKPVCLSLAYMYIYELLNGIGTDSPADSLQKMHDFETGFLDAGYGNDRFRELLHTWMFEFIITHQMPVELAIQHADPQKLKRDQALEILRDPDSHPDETVFIALCDTSSGKIKTSSVIKKKPAEGMHLFAEIWRKALKGFEFRNKDLFETCFGQKSRLRWYPLNNAVYWNPTPIKKLSYPLNTARIYHCQKGAWYEESYQSYLMNSYYLNALLHESDRRLRIYLNTGSPLKEKNDEAWAIRYIEAVIEADKLEKLEASRPKVNIDLSGLDQIRRDAGITRDSLLIDDETDTIPESSVSQSSITSCNTSANTNHSLMPPQIQPDLCKDFPASHIHQPAQPHTAPLDPLHLQILQMLINHHPISSFITSHHLMYSVVTDTINAALFDEIGDNVMVCDNDQISIVEDYRDEIADMLDRYGQSHEGAGHDE